MKANEFVKKFGLAKVRKLVHGYPNTTTYKFYNYDFEKENGECDEVYLVDLKRLIESHAMIENDFESVEIAKYEYMVSGCYSEPYWIRIKQAIADVESCQ